MKVLLRDDSMQSVQSTQSTNPNSNNSKNNHKNNGKSLLSSSSSKKQLNSKKVPACMKKARFAEEIEYIEQPACYSSSDNDNNKKSRRRSLKGILETIRNNSNHGNGPDPYQDLTLKWYQPNDYAKFRQDTLSAIQDLRLEQRNIVLELQTACQDAWDMTSNLAYSCHKAHKIVGLSLVQQRLQVLFRLQPNLIGLTEHLVRTELVSASKQRREAVHEVVHDIQNEVDRDLWDTASPDLLQQEFADSCRNFSQASSLYSQVLAMAQAPPQVSSTKKSKKKKTSKKNNSSSSSSGKMTSMDKKNSSSTSKLNTSSVNKVKKTRRFSATTCS